MRALAATDVPVPPALLLCDDASVIGTPFFIMGCVEGRVFRQPGFGSALDENSLERAGPSEPKLPRTYVLLVLGIVALAAVVLGRAVFERSYFLKATWLL